MDIETNTQIKEVRDTIVILRELNADEKEVENDIVNLMYRQHEITKQIHRVDNLNYMKILFKRYIEGKEFQTVANEISLIYEYVLNLHGKALKAFETANKEVFQKEGISA